MTGATAFSNGAFAWRAAYDASQTWSKAVFDHPLRPDGIAYYARHDDEGLCYGSFDRARGSAREIDRTTDLDQD
ncbi:hypothetical protein [Bradyrhizobium sp. B117]|uniref:hypothetical protein n=1 Tax=Bradyrhizobium sp. B117 TaxID=3140246 RepID=UPI003184197E